MEKRFAVWVEISANKEWILDLAKFQSVMEKCREIGTTEVILSVKDTTGFALYPSAIAPHYAKYDSAFLPEKDYVEQCFSVIKSLGMKCFAAFDTFAGGNKEKPHPEMPAIAREGFACTVYGLDKDGKAVLRESASAGGLHTVGSIDDFGEIFLNPAKKEVRDYTLSLLREFVEHYHPDGIVLDRVRYVGLSTDFSEESRKQWEKYSAVKDEKWPEDIYTIEKTAEGYREKAGKYFGSFLSFRMQIIHDFMQEVRQLLSAYPEVEFCDYTGSWYPLYDRVGANWALPSYEGNEFPRCEREKLRKTAYAEEIDTLLSGCYYEEVTILEAREKKRPADWYSVEGAAELAKKVAGGRETPRIIDSLFLDQYRKNPRKIAEAIAMCMAHSDGCMLFDLSYLVKENWWEYAYPMEYVSFHRADRDSVSELLKASFFPEYAVNEEKLESHLFSDREFSPECSLCMKKGGKGKDAGRVLGFSAVKLSQNQDLYPDTAWLSIFAVEEAYRNRGYGTVLLQKTVAVLQKRGIRKLFVGQDFANFFSGIPAPDEKKCGFFSRLGFTVNTEDHYDLEGKLQCNDKIEEFDSSPWEKQCTAEVYRGEKEALLRFLHEEFPGRWAFEAEDALEKGKASEEVLLLWNPERTEVLGYCMLSVARDGNGTKTGYGGLGPIGIAKKIRGRHVGDYLLHEGLVQLRKIGVETVNIDWTILKGFYGQFGFVPARTYRGAYKNL